jgi:aldehyde dehydrogenase
MTKLEQQHLSVQVPFKSRYENFIGGKWVAPVHGRYFENVTPVTGKPFCEIARSDKDDVELALDAAHAAKKAWGRTSAGDRANILNRIADRMEANLDLLAHAETWDNGKPLRETRAADMPLAIDHFRYFAGCIRAQEGSIGEIDHDTVAYQFHEPLGVVVQIIPWNFPILMATWKLAPALAAGNCVVLKPAEQTPVSILVWAELVGDLLPAGVLNIVNGFGLEAGKPLASSNRIAKIAFTGETTTGRLIMQYASQNLIPVTLELGGKSPNIFFDDVCAKDDDFFDKALEGFVMFALNQGEVCTCPSRALIQESVYDRFMERALKRVAAIKQGNPLDPTTMIGAQASNEQLEKILSYIDIGKPGRCEGAGRRIAQRARRRVEGRLLRQPTVFHGNNKMRIFRRRSSARSCGDTFKDDEEALSIDDTLRTRRGRVEPQPLLAAWPRDQPDVQTNCYPLSAHAAFRLQAERHQAAV